MDRVVAEGLRRKIGRCITTDRKGFRFCGGVNSLPWTHIKLPRCRINRADVDARFRGGEAETALACRSACLIYSLLLGLRLPLTSR